RLPCDCSHASRARGVPSAAKPRSADVADPSCVYPPRGVGHACGDWAGGDDRVAEAAGRAGTSVGGGWAAACGYGQLRARARRGGSMRRRGVTLLETLVALALTALVLAALEGTVVRAAGARARASAVAERAAAGRSILLRLTTELEAAPVADDPRQRFTVES